MIVGITGAVSTGKTTLSKLYCKLYDFYYISLKQIAEKNALLKFYDTESEAYVVDVNELEKAYESEIDVVEGNIIVESHLLVEQHFPLDKLIILRVSPLVLYKRMVDDRKYPKSKAYENALSEALDYFPLNALKHYPSKIIYELNLTNKSVDESIILIHSIIEGKAKNQYYSFPKELEALALMDKDGF